MVRAVLDANVIVSAFLRPEGPPGRILALLLNERAFEIVMSPDIRAELRRALSYDRVRRYLRLSPEDIELRLATLALLADSVEGTSHISVVATDPADDKYIVAAVEGRAEFIVSGDAHLLDVKEYHGIRVVTPRVFLALLKG